jgi:flagellar hook-associated protein 2
MTTIGRLDSFFTSLITDLMTIERQSLLRLKEQRDTVSVRRGAYQDVKSQLEQLQELVQSLTNDDPFSVVKAGRSVSISNTLDKAQVLTASASNSAVAGSYEVVVDQLARAQSRASEVQSSPDLALGLEGTFWLGGAGTAGASVSANGAVTGAGTEAVAANQRELGTGAYTLETRDNGGVLEFRLKDVDGRVVSIHDQAKDDGTFTTAWQALAAGTYDTGRGLTIAFSGAGGVPTTAINYTAAGVGVEIENTFSLVDIANAINAASQPQGRDLAATVVGKQLVLTAANTGTAHEMIYTDGAGLGFTTQDLQPAQNALFSVNNIDFVRSSNSSLTDVISGVTLSLAADAEDNQATLTVKKDMSGITSAIESFVSKFNSVQTYLSSKTSISSTGSGETITYLRGTLASDNIFSELRADLFARLAAATPAYGAYKSLRDIGVTIDDSLQANIDSDKLETALANSLDDVSALLKTIMGGFNTLLGRFTGVSTGYLDQTLKSFDTEASELDSEIQDENTRLGEKELALAGQFAVMQSQMLNMSYMQQLWAGIYGG